MLVTAALVLSTRRRPPLISLYLALMFCYGVAISVNDGWNEQIVKRGWTSHNIPSVLEPKVSLGWLALLVAALAVERFWFSRAPR
jgi:hypothetical protein